MRMTVSEYNSNLLRIIITNLNYLALKANLHYTRPTLIVGDDKDADCKTISEALELAKPGTVIKINEGRYKESIKITKPNLRIEARGRDKEKSVYLLGEEGPWITVDLKPNENLVIKDILVAHFGLNIANKFNEQIKDNEFLTANPKYLKQFEIWKDMDCGIMVLGGSIIMRNCLVSLKSLPENIKSMIPALVVMPTSKINIVTTEFRGNESIMTAGIISMNADVLISNSKFHNFKAGAIFVLGASDTNIKVSDSEIAKCGIVGIYSQGSDCKPLFLRMKISYIEGPAVRIYKANRAKIKGCEIFKCHTGIEVISADPFIIMNKIYKNYENGILTVSKGGLRWDALLKFNEIYKNKENGIIWGGKGNFIAYH
jgi:F-box protein 11